MTYSMRVKVSRSQLGKILTKIPVGIQPRVIKRFMRAPVLEWTAQPAAQIELLLEFFGQPYMVVDDLQIRPD